MTPPRLLDVVRRAHPGLDPGDVAFRSGQSHDVLITPDRVFRFARTAEAAAGLTRRAALLAALDRLDLGVAVPAPVAPAGDGFLVLRRLPGAPLDRRAATAAAGRVAAEYARLLRALAAHRPAGLPTADPHRWARFARDVRAELSGLMHDAGRERAERELSAVLDLDHVATGLVHGDLGGENALWRLDGAGPRLTGVVDWDDVAVGDPAEDLAAIGASYGPDLLDRVIALLGADRAPTWRRVRAYQGTFALQQALAGARDGDDGDLADGLAGYR